MKIMMTICAAAIAICGTLSAQPATTVDLVKVHFSTPVQVGDATIAAGDCSIQVLRGSSDYLILAFHPESGHTVSVLANRVSEQSGDTSTGKFPEVVLSRRGNDYRFERFLMPDHSGFEVLGSVE
ncbi:conserved exported hypothetical protein [Candidatus Sulfopaludibacter sp. SbA6]|nr:conserved exported hypothetical protein [Candidatus Sulfopaludibacter sp. SbA6]